jgi:hypothetical protein
MILEMKVPSPGESIKEVEIATWLVKDGDYVEKDQAIAEVDSDKATLELPAVIAHVSWGRTHKTAYAMAFLIFTHVNSGHCVFVVK